MDANEFQELCAETAIYKTDGVVYTIMGLTNEAGEVAGKYKKYLRDEQNWKEARLSIAKELGDTLWYAAMLSKELGFPLSWVMADVIEKLQDRKIRGVLGGSGDAR